MTIEQVKVVRNKKPTYLFERQCDNGLSCLVDTEEEESKEDEREKDIEQAFLEGEIEIWYCIIGPVGN
jgi:hypothetical protein